VLHQTKRKESIRLIQWINKNAETKTTIGSDYKIIIEQIKQVQINVIRNLLIRKHHQKQ